MKSFTIAASAMLLASVASGRVINKARQATDSATPETAAVRNGFELDVTTANLGLSDYYSRETGQIIVQIDAADTLQHTVVRSVDDDVVCTILDAQNFQIRKIGGDLSDEYKPDPWDVKAARIECFFEGEEPSYQTVQ
jgi:hypothetical protein